MKVYLLRHTEAAYGMADPDRPLTEAGQKMAAGLAKFVARHSGYRFSEIWSSPYLRARQTAAPFVTVRGKEHPLQLMDDLVPEADPDILVNKLVQLEKPVLVVGHNPHLTRVTQRLLGLGRSQSTIVFKKGMLFVFKSDPHSPTRFTLSACLSPGSIGLRA